MIADELISRISSTGSLDDALREIDKMVSEHLFTSPAGASRSYARLVLGPHRAESLARGRRGHGLWEAWHAEQKRLLKETPEGRAGLTTQWNYQDVDNAPAEALQRLGLMLAVPEPGLEWWSIRGPYCGTTLESLDDVDCRPQEGEPFLLTWARCSAYRAGIYDFKHHINREAGEALTTAMVFLWALNGQRPSNELVAYWCKRGCYQPDDALTLVQNRLDRIEAALADGPLAEPPRGPYGPLVAARIVGSTRSGWDCSGGWKRHRDGWSAWRSLGGMRVWDNGSVRITVGAHKPLITYWVPDRADAGLMDCGSTLLVKIIAMENTGDFMSLMEKNAGFRKTTEEEFLAYNNQPNEHA